jgi:hypothetical protein
MTDHPGDDEGPAPHPVRTLADGDLFRELDQLYRTRLETLRRGSDAAVENSDRRIAELEKEYFQRHPRREVSPRRLRPDDTSLRRGL